MKKLLFVPALLVGVVASLAIVGIVMVAAVDANYVQVPTIIYAVTIGVCGAAAILARRTLPKSSVARMSSVAFVIIALIAVLAYIGFRWHAERHRPKIEAQTNANSAPASTPTPVATTPKNSNNVPKAQRRKKK